MKFDNSDLGRGFAVRWLMTCLVALQTICLAGPRENETYSFFTGSTAGLDSATTATSGQAKIVDDLHYTGPTRIAPAGEGEIAVLKQGVPAFLASPETLAVVPRQMLGRSFIRAAKGASVKCKKAGWAAVIVPEAGIIRQSLVTQGFTPVDYPPFAPFSGQPQEKAVVLQKRLTAGERVRIEIDWAIFVFGDGDTAGLAPSMLHSLNPPVLLPDGREFKTWEPRVLDFSKTYYVDQQHPHATDQGVGSRAQPFKTIQRAADILQPGERVLIAPGLYPECVRPRRGGDSPARMISYEAVPGGEVILTGAETVNTPWVQSRQADPTKIWASSGWARAWMCEDTEYLQAGELWMTRLDDALLGPGNPLTTMNLQQWILSQLTAGDLIRPKLNNEPTREVPVYFQYSALVFQDGRRLTQTTRFSELQTSPRGSYWIEPDGRTLHIHPFENADPNRCRIEVTTRRQCFGPEAWNLGFIRVKGLTFEKVGNPFPVPQYGALSTNSGHHWIIEDNTVRWANSIGIDIGIGAWENGSPEIIGHHIVRGNHVRDIGVCGIAGVGGHDFGVLIESNDLERIAFHPVQPLMETAAIKTHFNENCLIRRNLIRDVFNGPGIWMDYGNVNSRCTQNIITRCDCVWGTLFLEASVHTNLVDHNIVVGNKGHGIYQHTCQKLIVANNLSAFNTGAGIAMMKGDRNVFGQDTVGGSHLIFGNVLAKNGQGIFLAPDTPASILTANVIDVGVVIKMDDQARELSWSMTGKVPVIPTLPILKLDLSGAKRGKSAGPGPLASDINLTRTIRLTSNSSEAPTRP